MDHRKDVHDFLVSRRARITPRQAGLPTYGDKRRVAGLRREEVASLAGVSFDYYARLERGDLSGVSESVLDGLARALQLDDAEQQHLHDLARTANLGARPRAARQAVARPAKSAGGVRPALLSILTGMTRTPAYVRNARFDILAANDLCKALYGAIVDTLPVNLARLVFLDPRAAGFFRDWDTVADDIVGAMRVEAGRNPRGKGLSDLIGELVTRSDEFTTRWAQHNVGIHQVARNHFHSPVIGDIELTGNALELPGEGLTIIAYAADVGSAAEDQLTLLATWASTSASGHGRRSVSPKRLTLTLTGGREEDAHHERDEHQTPENLRRHDGAGEVVSGGDVSEADRAEDYDREVERAGPAQLFGEGARSSGQHDVHGRVPGQEEGRHDSDGLCGT